VRVNVKSPLIPVFSRKRLCRNTENALFLSSSHFERSEKSLFRPKGEIFLRPLTEPALSPNRRVRDDSRMSGGIATQAPKRRRNLTEDIV
jgi:hypothetical protein